MFLSSDELPKIEKKMKELASQKMSFERKIFQKKKLLLISLKKGDEYKLELLDGLDDGQLLSTHKVISLIYVEAHIFLLQEK